jgi:hypothetical protein
MEEPAGTVVVDDTGGMDEQQLVGGVANAGSVVRVGEHVLRPSNMHSRSVHRFLSALHDSGFDGASKPVGIDDDGRERLIFIEGDVPVAPYPRWAQSDAVLASMASLLRALHDASWTFDPSGLSWSDEMADPTGGTIVCHNDVCLENVVFREGVAVGLLDFDFAAPGRPVYDLAQFARMCVPIDDEINAARQGWQPADLPARLRLVADVYRLDGDSRAQLLEILSVSMARGGEFVRRRVEAGDPNFISMWNEWAARNGSIVAATGGHNIKSGSQQLFADAAHQRIH